MYGFLVYKSMYYALVAHKLLSRRVVLFVCMYIYILEIFAQKIETTDK